MATSTAQFLISIPAEGQSAAARQFLLNLEVSLEPATEQDNVAGIQVTLCSAQEVTGTNPVPCSPGPAMENPNPGG